MQRVKGSYHLESVILNVSFITSHLYGLSVVDLHNVKAETIDPPPRSLENTCFQIKMVPDIY